MTTRKAILPPDPDVTFDEAAVKVALAVKLLLENGAAVIELTEETRNYVYRRYVSEWEDA